MTTTTLAPPPAVLDGNGGAALLRQLGGRYDGPADVDGELRVAAALAAARSNIPPQYRGSPGDVLALMYQAKALDVAIATAMKEIFFQDGPDGQPTGKGGMSGSLMLALIIRAGHRVRVLEHTEQAVTLELHRCDGGDVGKARWTLVEAARAGIANRESWIAYPGDMLYWRCLARLARQHAPDVVQGFGYTPEEAASFTVADIAQAGTVVTREPAPDVLQLLTDLAALDYAGIQALWRKAQRVGLLDQYAGEVEGNAVTVQQLLASVGERVRMAEEAAKAAPAPAADDVVAEPTPGILPCGCAEQEVMLTGLHACGIDPIPQPAVDVDDQVPAAVVDGQGSLDSPDADPVAVVVTPDDDEDGGDDVGLIALMECGCHPMAVEVAGHGPRCTARVA